MKSTALLHAGLFVLLPMGAFSEVSTKSDKIHISSDHFGTSGFSTSSPENWYTLETHSWPETTALSQNANWGDAKGGVYPAPWGFTIGEAGDYLVTVTAILQNPNEESTILIPVFLVRNETYEPDAKLPGGIATIEYQAIETINSTGIVRDVTPGTRFSIVATNAGYPEPVPVTVVSWGIVVSKI